MTVFIENHVITTKDSPNKISLVLYTNPRKCNLNCMSCHNKTGSAVFKFNYMDETRLKNVLETACSLVDEIVISGGEPTLEKNLLEGIKFIKNTCNKPIRLDSNGTNPELIKELDKYVDSFAFDIKIPLDYYREDFKTILGLKTREEVTSYQRNLYKTLLYFSYEYKQDKVLTRTVKYPLLTSNDIEYISTIAKGLGFKWQLNPFYNLQVVESKLDKVI